MPDLFGREGFERRSAEPRQLANDAATSTASQSGKLRGVRSAQGPYREHQDTIRRAKPEEAQLLTELCMRSKAYWGYDAAFLEGFRRELSVSPEYIANDHVFVLEDGERIVGFCGLREQENGEILLEDLFIEPGVIGKGYGKQLWQYAVKTAKQLGFRQMVLESDPNAEPFYRAMGAKRVGEVPSSVVEGRMLPLMRISLEEDA